MILHIFRFCLYRSRLKVLSQILLGPADYLSVKPFWKYVDSFQFWNSTQCRGSPCFSWGWKRDFLLELDCVEELAEGTTQQE